MGGQCGAASQISNAEQKSQSHCEMQPPQLGGDACNSDLPGHASKLTLSGGCQQQPELLAGSNPEAHATASNRVAQRMDSGERRNESLTSSAEKRIEEEGKEEMEGSRSKSYGSEKKQVEDPVSEWLADDKLRAPRDESESERDGLGAAAGGEERGADEEEEGSGNVSERNVHGESALPYREQRKGHCVSGRRTVQRALFCMVDSEPASACLGDREGAPVRVAVVGASFSEAGAAERMRLCDADMVHVSPGAEIDDVPAGKQGMHRRGELRTAPAAGKHRGSRDASAQAPSSLLSLSLSPPEKAAVQEEGGGEEAGGASLFEPQDGCRNDSAHLPTPVAGHHSAFALHPRLHSAMRASHAVNESKDHHILFPREEEGRASDDEQSDDNGDEQQQQHEGEEEQHCVDSPDGTAQCPPFTWAPTALAAHPFLPPPPPPLGAVSMGQASSGSAGGSGHAVAPRDAALPAVASPQAYRRPPAGALWPSPARQAALPFTHGLTPLSSPSNLPAGQPGASPGWRPQVLFPSPSPVKSRAGTDVASRKAGVGRNGGRESSLEMPVAHMWELGSPLPLPPPLGRHASADALTAASGLPSGRLHGGGEEEGNSADEEGCSEGGGRGRHGAFPQSLVEAGEAGVEQPQQHPSVDDLPCMPSPAQLHRDACAATASASGAADAPKSHLSSVAVLHGRVMLGGSRTEAAPLSEEMREAAQLQGEQGRCDDAGRGPREQPGCVSSSPSPSLPPFSLHLSLATGSLTAGEPVSEACKEGQQRVGIQRRAGEGGRSRGGGRMGGKRGGKRATKVKGMAGLNQPGVHSKPDTPATVEVMTASDTCGEEGGMEQEGVGGWGLGVSTAAAGLHTGELRTVGTALTLSSGQLDPTASAACPHPHPPPHALPSRLRRSDSLQGMAIVCGEGPLSPCRSGSAESEPQAATPTASSAARNGVQQGQRPQPPHQDQLQRPAVTERVRAPHSVCPVRVEHGLHQTSTSPSPPNSLPNSAQLPAGASARASTAAGPRGPSPCARRSLPGTTSAAALADRGFAASPAGLPLTAAHGSRAAGRSDTTSGVARPGGCFSGLLRAADIPVTAAQNGTATAAADKDQSARHLPSGHQQHRGQEGEYKEEEGEQQQVHAGGREHQLLLQPPDEAWCHGHRQNQSQQPSEAECLGLAVRGESLTGLLMSDTVSEDKEEEDMEESVRWAQAGGCSDGSREEETGRFRNSEAAAGAEVGRGASVVGGAGSGSGTQSCVAHIPTHASVPVPHLENVKVAAQVPVQQLPGVRPVAVKQEMVIPAAPPPPPLPYAPSVLSPLTDSVTKRDSYSHDHSSAGGGGAAMGVLPAAQMQGNQDP